MDCILRLCVIYPRIEFIKPLKDAFENKWTNEGMETEYSIHWYSTSSTSYWVFSREFSSTAGNFLD